MKKFKRIMALAIALAMVVGTMCMGAFADENSAGNLTPDAKISISGLDKDDTVHLYQILEWVDGDGWTLIIDPDYAALTDPEDPNFVQHVQDLIDNKAAELTKEDLEKIANVVKEVGGAVEDKKLVESPYTYETTQNPGMYMALVTPGTAGVIYNPIVVSADFSATPVTSEINASTAIMGSSPSVAKKEKITVNKTAEEQNDRTSDNNAHDVGDIVKFTITTKIPAYSNSFVNPTFNVSDTLSNGLEMVVDADHPFTVVSTVAREDTDVNPTTGATSFTVNFRSNDPEGVHTDALDSISELIDYADVEITYFAKITSAAVTNVSEAENTVEVEFSNNPNEDGKYGTLKDKTKHYTFTIDGSLLGNTAYQNSELVKVGVDKDGNAIEEVIPMSNGSTHAALAGAVFGLYKSKDGADKETESDLYKNDVFTTGKVTTDPSGLMKIEGLDVGTYWLKELDAPNGYIRDTKSHKVEITAVIEEDETSEIIDGIEVKYSVPVLKSYTIKIDDAGTSTFTTTLDGSETLTTIAPGDSSTEIKNTKGVELPSTGGIGTTIFYIVGAILVIGAGVVLITRRRMEIN